MEIGLLCFVKVVENYEVLIETMISEGMPMERKFTTSKKLRDKWLESISSVKKMQQELEKKRLRNAMLVDEMLHC